jgi:hypothetical protein
MSPSHAEILGLALALVTSACTQDLPDPDHGVDAAATPTSTSAAPGSSTTAPPDPGATIVTAPNPSAPAPLFGVLSEPVRTARAAPIAGGTLLVTADGATAVAADPDRDRVFLVDLASKTVRSVETPAGGELGRVVEGPSGLVFVAARRGGEVLVIDVAAARLKSRYAVCNAPRGMAYDAAQNRLYVACRSGRLAVLDATSGSVISTFEFDADLRDVLLVGSSLVLTRFRSAEILRLDATGAVIAREVPPPNGPSMPGVAYRGVPLPNGMFLLAHELESSAPLGTGFGAYYGGGCSGGGVVTQALSLVGFDNTLAVPVNPQLAGADPVAPNGAFYLATRAIAGALGPLDLAVSQDGRRIAVVASGNAWTVTSALPTLFVDSFDVGSGAPPDEFQTGTCDPNGYARVLDGEPVAVAFDRAGGFVVQSREPAELEFESGPIVPLSDESHFDTGFAFFHLNASGGISCASCHPEGGEDGHVWSFDQVGLRRSQALEGDVGLRTPFHWSGDLPDFHSLFQEVMMKRMALPVTPADSYVQALEAWLDTVPALAPADGLATADVARGRALFFDATVGCATCHSGPSYADNLKHDVGTGGAFVTPALTGVGLRAPLMHDGCASTLRERFGICGGSAHGNVTALADADIDALVTFMRSL